MGPYKRRGGGLKGGILKKITLDVYCIPGRWGNGSKYCPSFIHLSWEPSPGNMVLESFLGTNYKTLGLWDPDT